ncbi:MAG: exodeoxyribonuclease V subunit alpha [Mycobacteriaceae bacterium]|nr:exodeoxyribonuclease V subunit alpha [Mycobacteriaceae bacterium]
MTTIECRVATRATGLLQTFNTADVIDSADVHVARRLASMVDETDERVGLAIALVVRALRGGSVCVDLRTIGTQVGAGDLPWPQPSSWLAAIERSPLLQSPPVLRLSDGLLYLDRYWREEQQVADDLLALLPSSRQTPVPDISRLFPPGYEEQRGAAETALSQGLTVLTGGPGTGKTTTVARLLALFADQAQLLGNTRLRIALAAPTGKAAARLQEAVQLEIDRLDAVDRARLSGLRATTLHRLLGSRPDTSSRFKHHRGNRLPHDAIVVDETSMVSLTMMARLLEAVRPQTRLLLVGDPEQLASVEAGAVLADLVDGLDGRCDSPVAALRTSHRFGESIGLLAQAVRDGIADRAVEVLQTGGEHIEWIDADAPAESLREVLLPHALKLRRAAVVGDAPAALAVLDEHRLLCAHRRGSHGVQHWNRQVQRWLTEATGEPIWSDWYVGRPILVSSNDYGLGLFNGDTGVTIRDDGVLRAVIAGTDGQREFATSRLSDIETVHAMTIHKSQGSQANEVTVLLPPPDSRLLTRELLYTGVTRAKTKVRLVGSEAQVRAAIASRATRATGLARLLAQQ